MISVFLFLFAFTLLGPVSLFTYYARRVRSENLKKRSAVLSELGLAKTDNTRLVGFFHPYCNAGGGGERVLWTVIAALQRTEPDIVSVVYSGDVDASKQDIINKIKARFDITLNPTTLHFVFLHSRWLVEGSTWPRFTLVGQSIGSMFLGWEAMSQLVPDLYIDTMGYAFTFHVVSLLGKIPMGAYVHYPTISTDMLARVRSRKQGHTNADNISSSSILTWGKLLYYRIFMYYYALSLRNASFVMVNSSWTKNHVDSILQYSDRFLDFVHYLPPLALLCLVTHDAGIRNSQIVYPPCDTREMTQFSVEGRERIILSLAQFRPEKDHATQLHAFARLLQEHPEFSNVREKDVKLVLVGGSRNVEDATRVEGLRSLARDLGIEDHTQFIVNASYPDMLQWLSRSSVGLSTMVDEHFGINVVEFMAAGVIPVTHASGGPLKDIVVPVDGKPTGFHALTPETFATALHTALTLSIEEELALRRRARAWAVLRFSEKEFEKGWNSSGWKDWLANR